MRDDGCEQREDIVMVLDDMRVDGVKGWGVDGLGWNPSREEIGGVVVNVIIRFSELMEERTRRNNTVSRSSPLEPKPESPGRLFQP